MLIVPIDIYCFKDWGEVASRGLLVGVEPFKINIQQLVKRA